MFGLGWPEAIVIGVVALAIFGVKRIPELGQSMGKTLRGLRDELNSDRSSVKSEQKSAVASQSVDHESDT